MPAEPMPRRAVGFVDGQNLFYAAKKAFGYPYPNYDPKALAERIASDRGWTLVETFFYTGIPDASDNPFWHHFWTAKLAVMGTRGIQTFSRALRYRNQTVRLPNGGVTRSCGSVSKTIASIYGKTPEQWILVEVGDLIASGQAELQTGPFGTMLHASAYKSVGTPVVAVQHIGENRLRHVDLPRVDNETRERLARYRLRCFPMDSRPTLSRGQALRGNDGDRVDGHWAMQNERTEQACALDAATRLRRTFGGQVAANLKELGYGG